MLSDGKLIIDDGSTGHAFFDLNNAGLQIASGTTGFGAYKAIEYNANKHQFYYQGALRQQLDNDGIKFNGDTAAANALDDYEEGTFTPALASGYAYVSTIQYTNQHGHYTKIGNQVFAYVYIRPNGNSAHGGNIIEDANSLYLTGLPFANSNTAMQEGGGYITYTNGYFDASGTGYENLFPMPWVPVNSTRIYFHTAADGNNLRGNETDPNNRYLIFHLRYRVT